MNRLTKLLYFEVIIGINITIIIFVFYLQICWEPYKKAMSDSNMIPEYCMIRNNIWQAHVPLICHNIVEWHQPDRVLRQFGQIQPIPAAPVDMDCEHTEELEGEPGIDWHAELREKYLDYWEARENRIARLPQNPNPHTRRWIHPEGALRMTTVCV